MFLVCWVVLCTILSVEFYALFFPRCLSLALLRVIMQMCTFFALKADRCGEILIFFASSLRPRSWSRSIVVEIWTAKLPLIK
eukprot:UN22522